MRASIAELRLVVFWAMVGDIEVAQIVDELLDIISLVQRVERASVAIQGFKLLNGAGSGIGVGANSAVQYLLSMDFGACSGAHIYLSENGAICYPVGANTISGGAAWHVFAGACSAVNQSTNQLTLINMPAFSQAFARATRLSLIDATFWTFSGIGH